MTPVSSMRLTRNHGRVWGAVALLTAAAGILVHQAHLRSAGGLRHIIFIPSRANAAHPVPNNSASNISGDAVASDPVLIGRTTSASYVLSNSSSDQALSVKRAELSCSCASILKAPNRVAQNSADTIVISFTPGAFDEGSSVELTADLEGAVVGRLRLQTSTSAVPPFSGWPHCAHARQSGGTVIVSVDSRYVEAGLPVRVTAFDRTTDSPLTTQIAGGELTIYGQHSGIDLVIQFGGGPRSTWSGPVVITNE